jgi:hypothetical protein
MTLLAQKFCRCIKKVSKTLKVKKSDREGVAIAICTKTMLQDRRKKTLKRIRCKRKAVLETQPLLSAQH